MQTYDGIIAKMRVKSSLSHKLRNSDNGEYTGVVVCINMCILSVTVLLISWPCADLFVFIDTT